jgi:hypothetical protein
MAATLLLCSATTVLPSCSTQEPPAFTAQVDDAKGLSVGRPVYLRGVQIGEVSSVQLVMDGLAVEVTFSTRPDAPSLNEGICARVASYGLSQPAHLELHLGGDLGTPIRGAIAMCPSASGNTEAMYAEVVAALRSVNAFVDKLDRGERSLVEPSPRPSAATADPSASPRP